jgi:glutamate synthase domain-containing protein 1
LLPAAVTNITNNRQFLRELRDYQLAIKLFDESAEEIVREATRKQVEASLATAVEIARSPGKARDPAAVVEVRGAADAADAAASCCLCFVLKLQGCRQPWQGPRPSSSGGGKRCCWRC